MIDGPRTLDRRITFAFGALVLAASLACGEPAAGDGVPVLELIAHKSSTLDQARAAPEGHRVSPAPSDVTKPQSRAEEGAKPPPRGPARPNEPAPLLARLGPDTAIAVRIEPPSSLTRSIDVDAVLAAMGPLGERLRVTGRRLVGLDPFKLRTWTSLGVDIERPLGFAVLRRKPLLVAVGWRVHDSTTLRTLVHAYAVQRYSLREIAVEGAALIGPQDGDGVVFGWAGDEAWMVLGQDTVAGETWHAAQRLAVGGRGLLDAPEVKLAFGKLAPGPAVRMVVNLPAIVSAGLRTALANPRDEELLRKEDAARAFGDFKEADRLAADRFRRERMEQANSAIVGGLDWLLKATFHPFGVAALGVYVSSERLEVQWHQMMARGTLAARLFEPGSHAEVGGWFGEIPATARGSLTVRLERVADWLRGLAVTSFSTDFAELETWLSSAAQVNLARDLIGNSTGEVDVAVEQHVQPPPGPGVADVAMRWGLKDPDVMKRALKGLARALPRLSAGGDGGYAADLGNGRLVWLRVTPDALVVSPDPAPATARDEFVGPPQARVEGLNLDLDVSKLADAVSRWMSPARARPAPPSMTVEDTDSDGIPNHSDRCPTVAETKNGYQDEDGCPDERPQVVVTCEAVHMEDPLPFEKDSDRLTAGGQLLVAQLAEAIRKHTWIERLRVESVATAHSRQLAWYRAYRVRHELVGQGIPPESVSWGLATTHDVHGGGPIRIAIEGRGKGAPCDGTAARPRSSEESTSSAEDTSALEFVRDHLGGRLEARLVGNANFDALGVRLRYTPTASAEEVTGRVIVRTLGATLERMTARYSR